MTRTPFLLTRNPFSLTDTIPDTSADPVDPTTTPYTAAHDYRLDPSAAARVQDYPIPTTRPLPLAPPGDHNPMPGHRIGEASNPGPAPPPDAIINGAWANHVITSLHPTDPTQDDHDLTDLNDVPPPHVLMDLGFDDPEFEPRIPDEPDDDALSDAPPALLPPSDDEDDLFPDRADPSDDDDDDALRSWAPLAAMFRTSFNQHTQPRRPNPNRQTRTDTTRPPTQPARQNAHPATPLTSPLPYAAPPTDADSPPNPSGQPRQRRRRADGRRHRPAQPPTHQYDDPDAIPDSTPIADRVTHCAGVRVWAVDSANTNALQPGIDQVAQRTSADLVLLQEHRVHLARCPAARGMLKRLGLNAWLTPARTTDAGRASGGPAVLTRRGIGITPHDGAVPDAQRHRFCFAWTGAGIRGGVHVGSVYLHTAEGLSPDNLQVLHEIAVATKTVRGPWIIGGDWNMDPATLASSGWLDVVGGVIVAPTMPTTGDATLCYYVVARAIAHGVIKAQTVHDAGLHPHSPVRLLLRGDLRAKLTRYLRRPKRIDADLPPGPTAPPTRRTPRAPTDSYR